MSKKIVGVITPSAQITAEITSTGASAYEVWLAQGNVGTVQDFFSSLDKFFEHNQQTSSSTWTIEHNLNKFPSAVVVDNYNRVFSGEIIYLDKNNLKINFKKQGNPHPLTGKAYLN